MNEKAIEAVAKAIEDADYEFGYCMELTRLVDGVSTYTLTYNGDAESLEFGSTDEVYAHVNKRRAEFRTSRVIAAYEKAMWRPIEEAPKDGTLQLVWSGKKIQRARWDKVDSAWVLAFQTTTKRRLVSPPPTRFRYLPSPPEGV